MRASLYGLAAVAAAAFVGCATQASTERIAASQSAIRAAEAVGAQSVPQAALHLQLAREQFVDAQTLDAKGRGKEAEGLLYRAEADAELASVLAKEGPVKAQADQLRRQLEAVQSSRSIE
jgi:hypothetical protein